MEIQPGGPLQTPESSREKPVGSLHSRLEGIDHKITELKGKRESLKSESGESKIHWLMTKIGIGRQIVSQKVERAYVKLLIATKGDKASPTLPEKLPESVAPAEPERSAPALQQKEALAAAIVGTEKLPGKLDPNVLKELKDKLAHINEQAAKEPVAEPERKRPLPPLPHTRPAQSSGVKDVPPKTPLPPSPSPHRPAPGKGPPPPPPNVQQAKRPLPPLPPEG